MSHSIDRSKFSGLLSNAVRTHDDSIVLTNEKKIEQLSATNDSLVRENEALRRQNDSLASENERLRQEILRHEQLAYARDQYERKLKESLDAAKSDKKVRDLHAARKHGLSVAYQAINELESMRSVSYTPDIPYNKRVVMYAVEHELWDDDTLPTNFNTNSLEWREWLRNGGYGWILDHRLTNFTMQADSFGMTDKQYFEYLQSEDRKLRIPEKDRTNAESLIRNMEVSREGLEM